ncbi:MAG: hypothetical protein L3J22_11120 [Xanthomonadales bacterium]|nr:hypothetical protein [Xanthomonadales bacterium]
MKLLCLLLLSGLFATTSFADITKADVTLHPFLPGTEPYLIEIDGFWSSDCHPGNQKPIVSSYDGSSVLIEFEPRDSSLGACSFGQTQYSALVDMSALVGTIEGTFNKLDVTVEFSGAVLETSELLDCSLIEPCPSSPNRRPKPDPGLYFNTQLERQGLLIARQGTAVGVYPLIYDQDGGSQWLFSATRQVEDVFFSKLYELTGGQCLGCPLPDDTPQLNQVGRMTLKMDSEGQLRMKINDGVFIPYKTLVFGYEELNIDNNPDTRIINLSGRWAFSNIVDAYYNGSRPPTAYMSSVINISKTSIDSSTATVKYSITNLVNENIFPVEMECQPSPDYTGQSCQVFILEDGVPRNVLSVSYISPERLRFIYSGGPIVAVGPNSSGIAVKIN